MDHISDSGIILNEIILTLREMCPSDSKLLNFPINLYSVLNSKSKDISKDMYSSCQKDYIIFQSPQIPTKNVHYLTYLKL